jgi:hypothetical protein
MKQSNNNSEKSQVTTRFVVTSNPSPVILGERSADTSGNEKSYLSVQLKERLEIKRRFDED